MISKFIRYCFPPSRLKARLPFTSAEIGFHYGISLLFLYGGGLATMFAMAFALILLKVIAPDLIETLRPFLADEDLNPRPSFIVAVTAISMVAGFGSQILYLGRCLASKNVKLGQIISFNLQSMNGSLTNAVFLSVCAFAVWLGIDTAIEYVIATPFDATGTLLRQMSGWHLAAMCAIVVCGAPLAEEVVFRGILMNGCRTSFHANKLITKLGGAGLADTFAIVVSAAVFALAHFVPIVLNQAEWPETSALLSGMMILFAGGVVLGEVYRRSGTLVCPILVHAMNNAIVVLLIASGH